MNFSRIADNLFVGTYPEVAADVARLKAVGVTHVLNVREFDDIPEVKEAFTYCYNPTADWNPSVPFGGEPKPVEWFEASLDFWPYAKLGQHGLPFVDHLYVHCSAGVNRSATTAWMFLRALQLDGADADIIIDRHRLISTFGTFFDHPWRQNAEDALRTLGYIS